MVPNAKVTFCPSWKIAASSSICSAEFLTNVSEKAVARPLVQSSCGICSSSLAATCFLCILPRRFQTVGDKSFYTVSISASIHVGLFKASTFFANAKPIWTHVSTQCMSLYVSIVMTVLQCGRIHAKGSTSCPGKTLRRSRSISLHADLR